MIMKHMIVLLFLMVVHTIGKAENIIQVVPFETKAGITTDDMQSFSIEMRNSEKMLAFQFDILLPEGMSLDNTEGVDYKKFLSSPTVCQWTINKTYHLKRHNKY